MQDGIKNYFTRLEQARKIKKEAHERLGKFLGMKLIFRKLGQKQKCEKREWT
jgi:hypothetical protein